mgnify:CR=1 FL=1
MIQRLLADIRAYFEWLQQECGIYAAFHNYKIPLEGYVAYLAPYYINRHPYCLYVKSKHGRIAWKDCQTLSQNAKQELSAAYAMRVWGKSFSRYRI